MSPAVIPPEKSHLRCCVVHYQFGQYSQNLSSFCLSSFPASKFSQKLHQNDPSPVTFGSLHFLYSHKLEYNTRSTSPQPHSRVFVSPRYLRVNHRNITDLTHW